jgi:hypothetical protein
MQSTSANQQNHPQQWPELIIRDDDKETCMLMNVATWGDRNVIKKEDKRITKCKDLTIEIQRIGDTSNNRGDWNHFTVTQTIPEQHTGKARN